jgi:hypothetical protein
VKASEFLTTDKTGWAPIRADGERTDNASYRVISNRFVILSEMKNPAGDAKPGERSDSPIGFFALLLMNGFG